VALRRGLPGDFTRALSNLELWSFNAGETDESLAVATELVELQRPPAADEAAFARALRTIDQRRPLLYVDPACGVINAAGQHRDPAS
jgi:hypothetical protein